MWTTWLDNSVRWTLSLARSHFHVDCQTKLFPSWPFTNIQLVLHIPLLPSAALSQYVNRFSIEWKKQPWSLKHSSPRKLPDSKHRMNWSSSTVADYQKSVFLSFLRTSTPASMYLRNQGYAWPVLRLCVFLIGAQEIVGACVLQVAHPHLKSRLGLALVWTCCVSCGLACASSWYPTVSIATFKYRTC